ncbi:MAG TPA: RidA family protein [Streptosporangiaceae bacterium]|nr:RidA family protein [Streptosporangiaceae bacterium]
MNAPTPGSARLHFASGSPFESEFGFSRALRIGDRVLVAGTAPIWPDGHCPDDVAEQARRCFTIIADALGEAGATLEDVVRTRMFLTSAEDSTAVGAVHGELLQRARPVATMVIVASLLDPRWKVEIEAEAQLPGG